MDGFLNLLSWLLRPTTLGPLVPVVVLLVVVLVVGLVTILLVVVLGVVGDDPDSDTQQTMGWVPSKPQVCG